MADQVDLSELAAGIAELRDSVNTTRVICKGLQNQARAAVRLTFDLDERLGKFDSQLQALQRQTERQAMEAQRNDQHQETRTEPQAGAALARAV